MKFKSILSLLCATGVLAAVLTGCGSSARASSTISSSSSASTDSASSEISGQVQSVSATSLTLLVGGHKGSAPGQGGPSKPDETAASSGKTPPDSSASGQSKPDHTAPQAPQTAGDAAGSSDTGSASSAAQPDQSGSAPSQETMTITISDTTAIRVEGTSGETDGTIADITQSSFVDVTVDANNTATTIVVKNAGPTGAPDAQSAGSSAGTGTSSASSSN